MIRVIFVCHGNICRSPMAEFVFGDMVRKRGLADQFHIASAATSSEELGNPVHRGTTNKLKQYGISTAGKYATQLKKKDYQEYDYLLWSIGTFAILTVLSVQIQSIRCPCFWILPNIQGTLQTHGIQETLIRRMTIFWRGVKAS